MNCIYCDQIAKTAPDYTTQSARYDLGSEAPRCARHWRYLCSSCGDASHFMAMAYCPEEMAFYCRPCARASDEVVTAFWGWRYYFRYQSPWTGAWQPALDRLEFEGRHPAQCTSLAQSVWADAISPERYLTRYPHQENHWSVDETLTDRDVQDNWNRNAERWHQGYDEDGDRNRRYASDEPMLGLLGDVVGQRVLDVGSGNGYLCRKLAKAGAIMTGVELSDRFIEIAEAFEQREAQGVTYCHGSASEMDFLEAGSFDKAVSNYVLMDLPNYEDAVREVYRLLRPGGCFVVVISHPVFSSGTASWLMAAPDSPRREESNGFKVDQYFHRSTTYVQWGDFDPIIGFHRPLRDYWQTFTEAGFQVDGFEEPSITALGRQEEKIWRVELSMRITHSCMFRLVKPRS